MAEWWDKSTNVPLGDSNFQKIIDFYLFNCPCETEKGSKNKGTKTYTKVSKRAKTLRAQGWTGGALNTLLAAMKHTTSGHLEYNIFDNKTDIKEKVSKIEKYSTLSDKHFELIAMADRSDMSKTSAIFYYIRNAFAHGSFSVIKNESKTIYYLESAKDDTVKAQIRLREETLLEWIKDFKVSPKVLKSALAAEKKMKKSKKKGGAAA